MNCCDTYGNCNQGRDCPVRHAAATPSASPITDDRIEAAIDVWFEVGKPHHKDYKARMRAAIEAATKGGEL